MKKRKQLLLVIASLVVALPALPFGRAAGAGASNNKMPLSE